MGAANEYVVVKLKRRLGGKPMAASSSSVAVTLSNSPKAQDSPKGTTTRSGLHDYTFSRLPSTLFDCIAQSMALRRAVPSTGLSKNPTASIFLAFRLVSGSL